MSGPTGKHGPPERSINMTASQQAPSLRIIAQPDAIHLKAIPGSELTVEIAVTNAGRVTLALGAPGVAHFRQPDALARGIREGFIAADGDFFARLIALGQRLDHEDTVAVDYAYAADFTSLEPGASGRVEMHFHVPASAEPVAGWTARLPLLGTTLAATLDVRTNTATSKRKRRR